MKWHVRILLCIFLLGNSCNKRNKSIQAKIDDLKEKYEYKEIGKVNDVTASKKRNLGIDEAWLDTISINLNGSCDAIVVVKQLIKQFGLNVSVNVGDISAFIQYEAENKPVIEVLSEILEQLDLKIIISGKNAIISKDSMYIHNYSVKNLSSRQDKSITTSVDHDFNSGSTSNNVVRNEYIHSVDFYGEVKHNIELLIMNDEENCKFSINKQSGIISVIATQKIHKRISKYFNSILRSLNDEILVEANIIEIILKDRFGVKFNWNGLLEKINTCGDYSKLLECLNPIGISSEVKDKIKVSKNILQFQTKDSINTGNILNLLSYYGEISSISNPRMIIANNHSGTFKAIENYVYFDFKMDSTQSSSKEGEESGKTNISKKADIKTAIIGVIFTVHVVKLDNDKIKVYLKPTITDANGTIVHDGYRYILGDEAKSVENMPTIPRIKTRELESVLTLNNNQTVVIGGLVNEMTDKKSDSIFNIFSKLFKRVYNSKVKKKSEILIILTVKSLDHEDLANVHEIYFEK